MTMIHIKEERLKTIVAVEENDKVMEASRKKGIVKDVLRIKDN